LYRKGDNQLYFRNISQKIVTTNALIFVLTTEAESIANICLPR